MLKLKTPVEIGLPEKFTAFRDGQLEGLEFLQQSQKTQRISGVCAPTGFGKELLNVGYALLSKKPTCIVTVNKGLQQQYMSSYEKIGMVNLMGRNNYTCKMKEDYTCQDGYSAQCPYKGSVACPSSRAEMKAAGSNLVCTNLDKWVASRRFGTGMDHFEQVIFDEGHHLPSALEKAMQVVLHPKEINELLELDFPTYPECETVDNWRPWAVSAKAVAEEMLKEAYRRVQEGNPKKSWVTKYNHLRNLVRRLSILSLATSSNWLVELTDEGFVFDPISPARYAEAVLFLRVPHVIVTSATLRPKTLYMCGQAKTSFDFKEFDAVFDPKYAPVYWIPTMKVGYQKDMRPIWFLMDRIAGARSDRNGIVHTVSHYKKDEILKHSRYAHRMLVNGRGEAPAEMIAEFKTLYPGAILATPSVGTGYDFPMKECEWVFLASVPFQPPTKIGIARQENDKEYKYYHAVNAMVQAFGRHVRSVKDRGESFIGDDRISWLMKSYSYLAPKSFQGRLKYAQSLPPAPQKL